MIELQKNAQRLSSGVLMQVRGEDVQCLTDLSNCISRIIMENREYIAKIPVQIQIEGFRVSDKEVETGKITIGMNIVLK